MAVSQAADKVTKQLEDNYAAITTAFKKKDIKAIGNFLAPDYQAHDSNGAATSREKILADYKSQMGVMRDIVWSRKITKLVHQGKSVVLTVEGKINGTVVGADKTDHKIALAATAEDTWIEHGKGWLLKSTTIEKKVLTVDGKVQG